MTRDRYTPRQLDIIDGKIPDSEIITAEYTRILKWANDVGDQDVIDLIQPLRDNRDAKRKKREQGDAMKYARNHYDRIVVTAPKGFREKLKEYAQKNGISINSLIVNSILEKTNLTL